MRVCDPSSVYDVMKYFAKTITPRTFSKFILSHTIFSYNSFCVNVLLQINFGAIAIKFPTTHDKLEIVFRPFH